MWLHMACLYHTVQKKINEIVVSAETTKGLTSGLEHPGNSRHFWFLERITQQV